MSLAAGQSASSALTCSAALLLTPTARLFTRSVMDFQCARPIIRRRPTESLARLDIDLDYGDFQVHRVMSSNMFRPTIDALFCTLLAFYQKHKRTLLPQKFVVFIRTRI